MTDSLKVGSDAACTPAHALSFRGEEVADTLKSAAEWALLNDDGVIVFIGASVTYDSDNGDVILTMVYQGCERDGCCH